MAEHLRAVQKPGSAEVLPDWLLEKGRAEGQAIYKQEQRSAGGRGVRQRRAGWFAGKEGDGAAGAPGGAGTGPKKKKK